jgi:NAD(P)-dependent dehydrogenase (short-subunit alcohol dehydrogenase family)
VAIRCLELRFHLDEGQFLAPKGKRSQYRILEDRKYSEPKRIPFRRSGRSIINISSTFARAGAGGSIPLCRKHTVEGLTKSAPLEAAPFGARVNIVAPGPIETEMLHRFAGSEQRIAATPPGFRSIASTTRAL